MAAFPGAIPTFTGFTSTHTLAQDNHAAQHNLEQAEIIQLATKLGTGSSTPTSGKLLRGTGAGTSSWSQADLTTDVTGILPIANGGTGTTSTTGTGSVVFASSPTLSTPTLSSPVIANFTSATHDHGSTSGGGPIAAAAIPNDLITSAMLANGLVGYRQGGTTDDASWYTRGTSNTAVDAKNVMIQVGSILVNANPVTVTFPVAYAQVPIVVPGTVTAASSNVYTVITTITTTGFNIRQVNDAGTTTTTEAATWIAIGQIS